MDTVVNENIHEIAALHKNASGRRRGVGKEDLCERFVHNPNRLRRHRRRHCLYAHLHPRRRTVRPTTHMYGELRSILPPRSAWPACRPSRYTTALVVVLTLRDWVGVTPKKVTPGAARPRCPPLLRYCLDLLFMTKDVSL
ncbi:hypothetical protein J6590_008413 [Homalodisca vitripennis]|nr:hypothetical protein J6590_008413 [Homalodisca vitripennis]